MITIPAKKCIRQGYMDCGRYIGWGIGLLVSFFMRKIEDEYKN